MNTNQNKNQIKLEDIYFYFDAQQKDLLDFSSGSNKILKILNLKTKLLNLPKEEFEFVVNTIEKIVNNNSAHNNAVKTTINPNQAFKDAQKLFESINNTKTAPNQPINQVDKI